MTVSTEAQNFAWLLSRFAQDTAGVREAVAVSADGLLLASSAGIDTTGVDQFAAIAAGLTSLTNGAAVCLGCGVVDQVIVEMSLGNLFVMSMGHGASLAVLCQPGADIAQVAYEMTLLAERAGAALSPELISELKNVLTV
jgi:predicted regulator of Ras-like GTPase activity (Roadblock/LC7/MglB family)